MRFTATLLGFACVLEACSTQPVQLTAVTPASHQAGAVLPRCAVSFGEVRDLRKEPHVLGVIGGRAVKAPADTDAWILSALKTLESRGVTAVEATHGANGSSSPGLTASVALQQFWVTSLSTNKNANLVLQIQVSRLDGQPALEKTYRGARTVMNWSSGEGEIQRLIDSTWSNALDQIGADLLALCGS